MTQQNRRSALRSFRRRWDAASWKKPGIKWFVGVSAGIATLMVALVVSQGSTGPAVDRTAILAAELNNPRMLEVERRFICPCGRCGELELTECECDGPGGALEMKTMLARFLENGDDADQATVALFAQYGGLKPRQEWRQAEESES